MPGTSVPRALATNAVVRCNDLLDGLIRQIVVQGGPVARRSSLGLYEMMHAVGDSFSGSHTEGTATGRSATCGSGSRSSGSPVSSRNVARIPVTAYHKWNDHRDKDVCDRGGPGPLREAQLAPL